VRQLRLVILFIILFPPIFPQGQEKMISCNFKNVTFPVFCDSVYRQTGIHIFYNERLADKLSVTLSSDRISVFEATQQVLMGSGLEVSLWHNDIVVLPGIRLPAGLPEYREKTEIVDTIEKTRQSKTETEERYITGRKPGVTQVIAVGRTGSGQDNVKARILGRVIDGDSGEPLSFVPVYVNETKTGVITDINGFFTLSLSPGKYNAKIEYLGYAKERFILEVLSGGNFIVKLNKNAIQLKEIVVSGEQQINIRKKDPGFDQIQVKTIRKIPTMMGERDILKVSVTLPGILSSGEGAAGLNVRGSSSDQNAFYINGLPIYNTYHLFGFFSAFNSDIIKDFSIYKGHIPAQYGGRLASVFNITTRQGNRKRFTARGGISPITGNIVLEGPIKKDTGSFIFSARSSYSDWILSRLKDTTINASSAAFNDFSGGVSWDFKKTQLSVFGYHSSDHFRLASMNNYNYCNNGASFVIWHNYTNSLRGEFALIGSLYGFSTTDKMEVSSSYQHSYKLGHYEAHANFRQMLNDKNSMEYGGSFVLYSLDRGTVLPLGEKSLLNKVMLGNEKGIENALYISDSYDIKPWINLTLGLRYTLFNPLGPSTTYTYNKGSARDLRYISDTLYFARNRPIRWYHEPDVRASLNIETDKDGTVKLAFNQMHQNLFMLSSTTTIAPNTQWKLSDYHLLPSRSNQISLGVFRNLPKNGLEASVEVYYKRTVNYPEFKDGADFLKNPLTETMVLQGNQKAYGLEVYIKRSRRKLEGWLSYTFSRSIIEVNGAHPWDRINNGFKYPANYDVPHSLNLVLNYYLTRRIILSSDFTYQSGRPVTYPESIYYINGVPYLDYSKRNAYRIPDYIRTDLSLTVEGNLKMKKFVHNSLVFNLYNAAGRKNPYSVYFKTEAGRIESYLYSVVGVPIFTVTWLFKLGNYASD